jgi:hypothetical protein
MTVRDLYEVAIEYNCENLILAIEFLTEEKKALKLTDTIDKFTYYFQDKFIVKMNEYLAEYEKRR